MSWLKKKTLKSAGFLSFEAFFRKDKPFHSDQIKNLSDKNTGSIFTLFQRVFFS
jgi:hypothetical protein